jgi:hemoglobin
MAALRIEFDVYALSVRDRADRAAGDGHTQAPPVGPTPASLYARLGGHDVIVKITRDFVDWSLADNHLGRFFPHVRDQEDLKDLNERIVEFLCAITGGPCVYKGRDMKTAHTGLGITEDDWQIAVDLFTAALAKHRVPRPLQSEFLRIIEDMKSDIVESRQSHRPI